MRTGKIYDGDERGSHCGCDCDCDCDCVFS